MFRNQYDGGHFWFNFELFCSQLLRHVLKPIYGHFLFNFELFCNQSPPPPPPPQSVIYYNQVRMASAAVEAIYVGNKMNAYVVITRVMPLWSHTYFGSLRVEGVWFSKLSIIYCTHSKLFIIWCTHSKLFIIWCTHSKLFIIWCTHSKRNTRLEHHYSTQQFINLMHTEREYY